MSAALASLLAGWDSAAADEFLTPAVSVVRVEWRAVVDQLRTEIGGTPAVAANFSFAGQRRVGASHPRSMPALVQLNAATAPVFAGIARSTVPVLLPFDTSAYLADELGGTPPAPLPRYQAEFNPVDFFDAGPAGYDAVFSLAPDMGQPQRTFAKPVLVEITGSLLTYDLNDPQGGKGEPVRSLAVEFPDLRRFIREGYVRYAFTRFGVPYVVSIQCLDSAPRVRRLACREAYPVAERFLKALRIAGGLPARPRPDLAATAVERPRAFSPDFTYRPVGEILLGSGFHRQRGRVDLTAYSQIRFPLEAPAYVHSQSFGRRSGSKADQPNSAYPWRDNFCEARSFGVGQCANGFGHQGEDIRPGACPSHGEGPNTCDPRQQPIVAVRDGVVIRAPRQQAATLQINGRNEHIRFRYMHMSPSRMDADGLLNGRQITEGEKIGVVSNYLDHPNGTTRHLHFDVQVFTRDGWIWVNPYATLISAYERLIGGRGRELGAEIATSAATNVPLPPADAVRPGLQEGSEN
ncbi:peptidoglycan DD-metalloendopeptidase family protein [Bradyrhizobium sp.]|uniref:peptidoglycan DD-metalloendopeptidase family protein n=1 Tax=Bradyrhizobium sp. TaxID=376 RepID=UPI0025C1951E|nr:peptidoglycan DD-metalloendopeptidase family protein [Bradyrhizobium sp.]